MISHNYYHEKKNCFFMLFSMLFFIFFQRFLDCIKVKSLKKNSLLKWFKHQMSPNISFIEAWLPTYMHIMISVFLSVTFALKRR